MPQTFNDWGKQHEIDTGAREGLSTHDREHMKALERDVIEPSIGSRGGSYDNTLAETINGLYKAELIQHRAPWKSREFV